MNKVNLVGRLTNKPELRYTDNNVPFSRFAIAINRPPKEDGTQEADFIDCVVWKKQAENLCKYQEKGNLIAVEGEIRKSHCVDKDGNNKYFTDVLVNRVEYLSSKNTQKTENAVQDLEEEQTTDPFADFGDTVTIDDNYLD